MQVGRQPRGGVRAERVVLVLVVAHVAVQEVREQPARRALAAARRLARPRRRAPASASVGSLPLRTPRRQARQRARGADHLAARLLEPRAVERAEHRVRLARLGADRRRGRRPPRHPGAARARSRARGSRPRAAGGRTARRPRSRGRPRRSSSAASAGSSRSGGPSRNAMPPSRSSSSSRHSSMKRVRVAGGVPAAQQPRVEAEDRHDVVVPVERGAQRGLVVRAQIPRQPEDGGHRARR